ncbi:MAG: hypothetical protein Q9220_001356 [cf. Caloplaca sp. 1 TL-2023]
MTASIASLPYEILSLILELAAYRNGRQGQQYTYGMDTTSTKSACQRILRGQVAPDAQRWFETDAIRCVSWQWHDWACRYALRDLYIRRWRGSERWARSRELAELQGKVAEDVVYRDPYCSLRKTADLFINHPDLATSIRRLVFDGFYNVETNAIIFRILDKCDSLHSVSLPWTALRYGRCDEWSKLLSRREDGSALSSLELLAVDLKSSQIADYSRQLDETPLIASQVDFSHLQRIKFSGSSNFMPINDEDLLSISRTARLRELHITGTTSITTTGLLALLRASRDTLTVLEHSPLADAGFEHLRTLPSSGDACLCKEIFNCTHLTSLAVSLPTICENLFSNSSSIRWAGEVQIRAAGICGNPTGLGLKNVGDARRRFFTMLSLSRLLVQAQRQRGIELNIEIFIDNLIFEPAKSLVHTDLSTAELLSGGSWPPPGTRVPSSKGPYGQTGQYGKDGWASYSAVSEEDFEEGLERGYISF